MESTQDNPEQRFVYGTSLSSSFILFLLQFTKKACTGAVSSQFADSDALG